MCFFNIILKEFIYVTRKSIAKEMELNGVCHLMPSTAARCEKNPSQLVSDCTVWPDHADWSHRNRQRAESHANARLEWQ